MAKNNVQNASRSRSGEKVTVACKMPHGLILQLQEQIEVRVPVMGGGFAIEKQYRPTGQQITVNGNRFPHGTAPTCEMSGGYALTPGVDKDFWNKWLEQNSELDLVKNKLIFASPSVDHARGEAQENKTVRSGLEPLNGQDPFKDPRVPKGRFAVQQGTPEAE